VILARDPLPGQVAPQDIVARPTDINGRAVFDGVPPGAYRLLAYGDLWDDSLAISPDFYLAHQSAAEAVKLDSRENRTVRLKVSYVMSGK